MSSSEVNISSKVAPIKISVYLCMYATPTQMWHPAHTTTFVLPVFEIEQIIVQLSNSLGISGDTIDDQIKKEINNWQTVLSNYRLHNSELTPMFSVENVLFLNMTNSFRLWDQGIISDADLVGIVDTEKQLDDDALTTSSRSVNDPRNVAKFYIDLSQSFHTVSDSCSSVIPQYQSSYMQTICADFDASSWTGFSSLLDGACDMPGAPAGPAKQNPLRKSQLVQSLCAHRIAAAASDIPGGLSSDGTDDSLMGFMKKKEKYLTFGAKSPIEISWTSSISDSKSFNSNLEYSGDRSSSVSGSVGGSVLVVTADSSIGSETSKGHSISIGKSSSSSHNFEKTVSIVFNDNDYGESAADPSFLPCVLYMTDMLFRRLFCGTCYRGPCVWHSCVHHYGGAVPMSRGDGDE